MDAVPLVRVLARLHERASEEVERLTEETAEARVALWELVLTVVVCGDLLLDLVDAALESEEVAP
jgi:hypothetical protein